MRESKLGSRNPRFGKPGTLLGVPMKNETKIKLREARKKQIVTSQHRANISESLKRAYRTGKRLGKNSAFYIDGRHEGKTPIKQSYEYRCWRNAVFERDDYTCQVCKLRGGELQADHIRPQSIFPELRFSVSNGRTLCRPCHQKTDTWGVRTIHYKNTTSLLNGLDPRYGKTSTIVGTIML